MPKPFFAAASALFLLSTALSSAQTVATSASAPAPSNDVNDTNITNTIIVSALRVPVVQDRVSSSITVLDLQDIQQAQPIALSDILQTTPGISLARNGGYGAATSLRIRGASSGESVVVIDGMRMIDPTATDNGFDFSQLFTDDIARIEVLRGPQAILWGSDAIGGVINVITRAPTRPLEGDFSVEAGSHETLNAHAGLGGTSSLVDWRISGSEFTTAGIPSMAGGTIANPYQRQAASGTARFHLADNVSLDLRGYWDGGRNSYSDNSSLGNGAIYAGDYGLTKQWSVYAGLNVSVWDGRFKNRLAILQNQTDNEQYTPIYAPDALQSVGHGRTRHYEYQGSLAISKGVDLIFGAEREEQRMMVGTPYDSPTPFDLAPHKASTDSVYGEVRITPATGLTLNGGIRYDHQSAFGGNRLFSAGAAYTPDGGITLLRASYDQGYKAPSLYQLYSSYGNPALRPEQARGWEAGVERSLFGQAVHLGAVWFERHSSHSVNFVSCPDYALSCLVPGTGQVDLYGYYVNIDKTYARGLELTGDIKLGHAFAHANYSINIDEDQTPAAPTYGTQLPRVPRHIANGQLGYAWPHSITTSVAVRWSGATGDTDYNTYMPVTLTSYTLVDARAEWHVPAAWYGAGQGADQDAGLTLFGRVENIGNRHYQTAYGYNNLGRVAYLGLRGRF